jgi:hypothetical protein
MPAAARADSEYLGGAVGIRMSVNRVAEDEHPSSSLRHSEVTGVQYPEGPPIPELPHRMEEDAKVAARMGAEESRNVLHEEPGRSELSNKVKEGEGEAAALSCEPSALPGDGEVLTREAT